MRKTYRTKLTKRCLMYFSLFILFFMAVLFHEVSALTYQDEVDVQFTFNPTINITVGGDLTIEELAPGNYADSNIITVTAGSNALSGYTLYATVGNDVDSNPSHNNTNLNNTESDDIFSSINTSKATLADFDANANTWGYSYSIDNGDNWINGDYDAINPSLGYNGLPLYNTTGIKLAEANNKAGESSIKFKIGARATEAQASGTYTNVVNFVGVAKPVVATDYTINYHANAGTDTVTNMPVPNPQTGTTSDATVTLNSSTPERTYYTFSGWCNTDNTANPSTCSGTITQPGNIYALNTMSSSITVDMYGVWSLNTFDSAYLAAGKTKTSGYYTMQDMSTSICSSVAAGQTGTLIDTRDNNTYNVAKIDNKCWMTQNLNYNVNTTPATGGCPTRERGCYYEWDNALNSCPANWVLPTSTDYTNLIQVYDTDTKLVAAPFRGVYGGYYDGHSTKEYKLVGTHGLYWSSTAGSAAWGAYGLRFYNEVTDIELTLKDNSRPIRCLAE